jgi:hypothetical protein
MCILATDERSFELLGTRLITNRASELMRSLHIGFLLYGITDEPICLYAKGSLILPRCCNKRKSQANFEADAAIPHNTCPKRSYNLHVAV